MREDPSMREGYSYQGVTLSIDGDFEAAVILDQLVDLLSDTGTGSDKRLALIADLEAVLDKHCVWTPIRRLQRLGKP